MVTTTIRVDTDTHAALQAMAEASGMSLIDTVRAAPTALHRQRFAEQVSRQLDELRADTAAWADYLADADLDAVLDDLAGMTAMQVITLARGGGRRCTAGE